MLFLCDLRALQGELRSKRGSSRGASLAPQFTLKSVNVLRDYLVLVDEPD